ncbi:UDP-phosphate glycosyltransferase [Pseudarthrobacter sp. NS4]|uniref:UDP-phosphate glycosyltransferase n=1 Tax=Pseudarthrobacter sp. NS4 TaxID=2973976 RepID=UPI0021620CD1|nr:UDP-phosphate glycosyltransferase [Pseudarthrobacter sp. NS4]
MTIYISLNGQHIDASWLLTICLLAAVFASVVGAVEDLWGLRATLRFLSQLGIGITSSAFLVALTGAEWWWIVFGAFAFATYTNAANFMDGINGISALHGLVVGTIFVLLGARSDQDWLLVGGVLIAAVFTAFLPWNLMGGRMFLGDAGSYLLGASIATIAIAALLTGINPISVAGPLIIYISDVASTLIRRIRAGENWAEAHRSHVYQRLTDQSLSHITVSSIVSVFSLIAGMVGLLALGGGLIESATAVILLLALTVGYLLMPMTIRRHLRHKMPEVN